jgi:threonine synthase
MGLPVDRLVIATNDNDILARAIETGEYRTGRVVETTSPSMDIQVSSNFERLLFEACRRDAESVRRSMSGLRQSGAFTIEAGPLSRIREKFAAGRASMAETAASIRDTLTECGYLADPHTATALHVAGQNENGAAPMVVLATAHPAKFPDAVEAAAGVRPVLPARLSGLMESTERFAVLPSKLEMVEDHIRRLARAAS